MRKSNQGCVYSNSLLQAIFFFLFGEGFQKEGEIFQTSKNLNPWPGPESKDQCLKYEHCQIPAAITRAATLPRIKKLFFLG